MLAKRLQGGGLVIVDCEQGLETANPERVPQDRSQGRSILSCPLCSCHIPGAAWQAGPAWNWKDTGHV